jgi:hypothetical protein
VRELYSDASQILGYDLLKLSLEGPKSVLDETKYCQVIVQLIKSVKVLLLLLLPVKLGKILIKKFKILQR